jgi:hypothetical protein
MLSIAGFSGCLHGQVDGLSGIFLIAFRGMSTSRFIAWRHTYLHKKWSMHIICSTPIGGPKFSRSNISRSRPEPTFIPTSARSDCYVNPNNMLNMSGQMAVSSNLAQRSPSFDVSFLFIRLELSRILRQQHLVREIKQLHPL